MTLGMLLLWGPRGGRGLMIKEPLWRVSGGGYVFSQTPLGRGPPLQTSKVAGPLSIEP